MQRYRGYDTVLSLSAQFSPSSFTLPPLLTLHSETKTKQKIQSFVTRSPLSAAILSRVSFTLSSRPQFLLPAAMSKKSAEVDAIIAEAMDACALEQIARLNTAHLSSSSALPGDLESRFRKLKSLPARPAAAVSGPTLTAAKSLSFGKENNAPVRVPSPPRILPPPAGCTGSDEEVTDEGFVVVSPGDESERKMAFEAERGVRSGSGIRAGEEVKPKKSPSSPDYGFGSGFSPIKRRSLSPTQSAAERLGCCLFLSPKRKSGNTPKSKGRDGSGAKARRGLGLFEEEQDELRDTREFYAAIKEQQKKLKKTLKEQDKVSREAAKLVRQSKEASARMRANTDELFSDEDEDEL